jgi:hypothetical protein
MMPLYTLFLASGQTWTDDDERDVEDINATLTDMGGDDDLPDGWVWVAGLRVRRATHVVAFAQIDPVETNQ